MTARPELIEDAVLPAQPLDWVDNEDDDDEIYYYYDDEDNFRKLWAATDMPGSDHDVCLSYLTELLRWLFRLQICAIYRELNFYRTDNRLEKPLYPDIALVKGQPKERLISYRLGVDGPPPSFVIEVISNKSRRSDLYSKPNRYQTWQVAEYFAYDPREQKRRNSQPRLWGWQMNEAGVYTELVSDRADGRLWSEQINCWLVPDDYILRLCDKDNRPLLTQAERLAQRLRELGEDPDSL